MSDKQAPGHSSRMRWIELLALGATLAATFGVGFWIGARKDRPVNEWIARPPDPKPYDPAKGFPRPGSAQPEDPRQAEELALAARAKAIRENAATILTECQQAAGGDWEKWQQQTEPFRTALRSRIDILKELPHSGSETVDGRWQPLEGLHGFPLVEVWPQRNLNYLCDPQLMASFRHDRPVVAVDRWLRRRGIDLIFVPVPKMTEVYVNQFLDPCPKDGIIAPHLRRALLELLQDGVEVVDGLSLFRATRDADAEYLYNTADSHWAPRGMRIMAKQIADRIERYRFATRARFGLPIIRTGIGPYLMDGQPGGIGSRLGWMALSPEQQRRAEGVQTTNQVDILTYNGRMVSNEPTSPVHVVGHSYVNGFREQLIKELNLLTCNRSSDHQTTEAFIDFLRDPKLLEHCRVVVWITTEQHLTRFQPLPSPILECLKDPIPGAYAQPSSARSSP